MPAVWGTCIYLPKEGLPLEIVLRLVGILKSNLVNCGRM